MKRRLILLLVLGLVAVGSAAMYQAAARERSYRTLLAQGDGALRDDQTFSAIEAYSGAIGLRPDSMLAHLRRGESYRRRGELDAAAKDFQIAAALDPSAIRPLDELGDIRYEQERFHDAAEIYGQCLRLDDHAARVSYKLALAHYRDGNLDGALTALDVTLRVTDRMPDVYYLQGLCFRDRRQPAQAQAALEKVVALSPGLIPAREELADLYGALGRRGDELEQLQLLAGLDGSHVERQVAVGLAHARWAADPREPPARRAGHADLAVLTLGGALDRTPDQPLVYSALGRVWLEIAQTRDDSVSLGKALEALARAAARDTATSDALTLYGRALLQSGRSDLAEVILREATRRYPVEPAAFTFYATAAEQQHHLDAARQAVIQSGVLMTDEQDLIARAARIGMLSLQLNDLASAVEWFRRAFDLNPSNAELAASLADAQLKIGDRSGAEKTLARGLEKNPDDAVLLAIGRKLQ